MSTKDRNVVYLNTNISTIELNVNGLYAAKKSAKIVRQNFKIPINNVCRKKQLKPKIIKKIKRGENIYHVNIKQVAAKYMSFLCFFCQVLREHLQK